MFRTRKKSGFPGAGKAIVALAAIVACAFVWPAYAATASFNSSVNGVGAATGTQVDFVDGAGYTMANREVLTIVSNTVFGTTNTDTISLFHFSTGGRARFRIRVGYMDANGVVQFISGNRNGSVRAAGGTYTLPGNLMNQCANFGGCNFIQITARGNNYVLDGVAINGTMLTAAAPTPEPGMWGLMIIAFLLVALRLKHIRRRLYHRHKKGEPYRGSPVFAINY